MVRVNIISIIHRLCTDLQTLIQERAEIEKGYAKNLRTWSKKWAELIEKGKSQHRYCETNQFLIKK